MCTLVDVSVHGQRRAESDLESVTGKPNFTEVTRPEGEKDRNRVEMSIDQSDRENKVCLTTT